MKNYLSTTILICLLITSISSSACSALFIKNGLFFLGKNFDGYNSQGLIVKNSRGVKKTAYGLDSENVVSWTSKYGSVTFNQWGKEFPYGGVNERGLAIEMLWLPGTYYEESNQPTLSEMEWIQYQLDNYKTAAEVQYYLDSVNINPIVSEMHYIVADRGGRCFVVDFVNGKAVVSNTDKNYLTLTNSNYKNALKYYNNTKDSSDYELRTPYERFGNLSSKAEARKIRSVENMFSALKENEVVGEDYNTQWSIVYDLYNYRVLIKTRDSKKIKKIELRHIDFTKLSPTLSMDINVDFISWEFIKGETNAKVLNETLSATSIKLNSEMLNKHMMQPANFIMDDTYSKHHRDLKINFVHKKEKGNIIYTLTSGAMNFKSHSGSKHNLLSAKPENVATVLYSLPIDEYALTAFHDKNNNLKNDYFLGIPLEPYGYSNNVSGFLWSQPGYDKAKFNLEEKSELTIKLK